MSQSWTEQAISLLAASGFGAVVVKLLDLTQARRERSSAEPASLVEASAEFHGVNLAEARDLFAEYRRQLAFVREEISGVRAQAAADLQAAASREAKLRQRIDELEAENEALDRKAARLLELIERYENGRPLPAYHLNPKAPA